VTSQTERIAGAGRRSSEWRKSERRISAKDARAACHRCSAMAAMESAVFFLVIQSGCPVDQHKQVYNYRKCRNIELELYNSIHMGFELPQWDSLVDWLMASDY
jgi:hypothetical protein